MRMESYSPQRTSRGPWVALLVVLAVGVIIYIIATRDESPHDGQPANGQISADPPSADGSGSAEQPAATPTQNGNADQPPAPGETPAPPSYDYRRIEGMTPQLAAGIGPSPITVKPISDAAAQEAFRSGMEAYQADKLLEARTLLNRAYTYGNLPAAQADQARRALTDLANRTILRPDPYANPKDPYVESYTFKFGDRLGSRRGGDGKVTKPGIIARLDLNVPSDIIVLTNGLQSDRQFKADRTYKMVKGPFHLVVDLSEFAADLYIQDLFLRRMPVCIGAVETPTPTGYFHIPAWSGKTPNSPYNAPVETGMPNVAILPGEAGYPLGPRGLNIKLEGIRQLGTMITANQSYAVHGTNDPASVGTAASRGCVRMRADDIYLVYACLMDYANPNDPRINWTRYSTVTIKK